MKNWKSRILIALVLTIAVPLAASADTWQIDPVHTSIGFTVRHMTISSVRGQFDKFAGTITAKDHDPASVVIDVTIDTSSIDTRSAARDADLKSANFLDVAKYPTMTFKSKKVEAAGPGKFNVVGDLTLHGVTKEVTLAVDVPSAPIKDPWGNERAGASATTTISRKAFGLTWNKLIEAGGAVVGDEVSVSIDVEAVKKK
ncbi:MAG TPA: YceI family protein [Candidatus Binataceae bacterium]|nr:YceI family protein [Candidatus Binataceae bacterium]